MKLLIILLLSLTTTITPTTSSSIELLDHTTPISKADDHNFRPLTLDPKGLVQITSDGIARSLDIAGNVIDYNILPNTTDYYLDSLCQPTDAGFSTIAPYPSPLSYYPRCVGMRCHDTYSCRVVGCHACIQSQNQWRDPRCVQRPAWYPPRWEGLEEGA